MPVQGEVQILYNISILAHYKQALLIYYMHQNLDEIYLSHISLKSGSSPCLNFCLNYVIVHRHFNKTHGRGKPLQYELNIFSWETSVKMFTYNLLEKPLDVYISFLHSILILTLEQHELKAKNKCSPKKCFRTWLSFSHFCNLELSMAKSLGYELS